MIKLFIIFLFCFTSYATTYYVDFDAGNDASAGTSTATAWRTIPGTYKADGSGFLNAAWGSITTLARIQDGDIIKIKCGTTHTSAVGGYVWIGAASGHFYSLGFTNLVIESDTAWGTGTTATLDGDGMTIGIGMMLIQIDGVTVRGLIFNNSDRGGIQAKEKAGTSAPLTNLVFSGLSFFNNGKIYLTDASGSGDGQLNLRKARNVLVTNCTFNGDQNYTMGILAGDGHKYVSGLIIDCIMTNHLGDFVGNDSGSGIKALNGKITIKNCISSYNLKGLDLGEDSGDDAEDGGGAVNILYKAINCTTISNTWGINFSGPGTAYAGTITWYAINNLITDNIQVGMSSYAGPYELYAVHNVFEDNGLNPTGTPIYNASHVSTTPDSATDTATIKSYFFNNVFRGQKVGATRNTCTGVFRTRWQHPDNDFTLTSDYNSYEQTGTNTLFCIWSVSYGPAQTTFDFGINGPGHSSGNWYLFYANDTTPPALGTGHFHCDSHSKGTSCDDSTLPQFVNVTDGDYRLMTAYPGSNLSTQTWYISEMGIDRSGSTRTIWDIGMFESARLHRLLWKH